MLTLVAEGGKACGVALRDDAWIAHDDDSSFAPLRPPSGPCPWCTRCHSSMEPISLRGQRSVETTKMQEHYIVDKKDVDAPDPLQEYPPE